MNGVTDQLHSIKTLNPKDLNKEMVKNITFYPPGGSALISLFTIVGVPLGISAKVVTWLSFLSGCVACIKILQFFQVNTRALLIFACIIPFHWYTRIGLNPQFVISSDVICFGILLGLCLEY